jgi:diguanylate cyclase (GGDEF)-like protein
MQPLSVIVLDLNGFKAFNDKYGHPAGDEVLREVAHSLTRSVRSADVVARYGGDEFGLILPQADAQAAQRVTQRICTAIHLAQATVHGITLSAGTATLREGMTARDLVAEEDRAMYLQRAEQRGQAVARPADR